MTVFRPKDLALSEDEKELLKLLNIYDPYVAEFFFGGRTVLVEGDTEYTAFRYVCSRHPESYRNLHVVRARGKATLVLLAKILNQFEANYSLLHDSDTKTILTKDGKTRANSAWTLNQAILDTVSTGIEAGRIRLVASVTNFEIAYLSTEYKTEKPYRLIEALSSDETKFGRVKQLLDSLLDRTIELPTNAIAWVDIGQIDFAISGTVQDVEKSNLLEMPSSEVPAEGISFAAEGIGDPDITR
jgi:putative ATP-dependent endonuclease of OLD family